MAKAIYRKRAENAEMGKKLYLADEGAFKRAEKMLYDELSLVLEIPSEDVSSFIERELNA